MIIRFFGLGSKQELIGVLFFPTNMCMTKSLVENKNKNKSEIAQVFVHASLTGTVNATTKLFKEAGITDIC